MAKYSKQNQIAYQKNKIAYHYKRLRSLGVPYEQIIIHLANTEKSIK